MKSIYRPCPICSSTNIENIKHISFTMEGLLPDFYHLAKCSSCGFVYANTSATKEDYDRYYNENNRYNSIPKQENSTIKTYNVISRLISKHIKKDDKVLDVGCGSGDMLKLMKSNGYCHLTGLDPSQTSIDKLSESDIFGIKGTIYDKPSKDMYEKFDLIILSGVLEHLYDLTSAINNIKLYTKQGGKILCAVPNAIEYALYPSPLPHYINIEHINHFTPNAITHLFSDNGFSLLDCISTTICFGNKPDPALLAIFEYTEVINIALKSITAMILNDEFEQKKLIDKIYDLVSSGRKIAVFGTGNLARALMVNTVLYKANIACFLDNDSSMYDKRFCGYKVNPPDFLKNFDGEVLILSMHGYDEIENQIRDMGFGNIISF